MLLVGGLSMPFSGYFLNLTFEKLKVGFTFAPAFNKHGAIAQLVRACDS